MISGPAKVLDKFCFNVYFIMQGCVITAIFEIYDELKFSTDLKRLEFVNMQH